MNNMKKLSKKMQTNCIVEYIFHSNGYDGNTLNHEQTLQILEGKTVPNKTAREEVEVLNYTKALVYCKVIAQKQSISEKEVHEINRLLSENICAPAETAYRIKNIYLTHFRWTPVKYTQIQKAMKSFIAWFNEVWNFKDKKPDLFILVDLQVRFLNISPFLQNNEKIARLLVNIVLWHNKQQGIIFKSDDSKRYYTYLNLAREGKPEHLEELMETFKT